MAHYHPLAGHHFGRVQEQRWYGAFFEIHGEDLEALAEPFPAGSLLAERALPGFFNRVLEDARAGPTLKGPR
jgi:hypothetical protein